MFSPDEIFIFYLELIVMSLCITYPRLRSIKFIIRVCYFETNSDASHGTVSRLNDPIVLSHEFVFVGFLFI